MPQPKGRPLTADERNRLTGWLQTYERQKPADRRDRHTVTALAEKSGLKSRSTIYAALRGENLSKGSIHALMQAVCDDSIDVNLRPTLNEILAPMPEHVRAAVEVLTKPYL